MLKCMNRLKHRTVLYLLSIMYHRSKLDVYIDKREIYTRQNEKIKYIGLHPRVKKAFKSPKKNDQSGGRDLFFFFLISFL